MLKFKRAALLLIALCVLWFIYVQALALVPNYRDHAFHAVAVDIQPDDEVAGWQVFDDKENVGRWTRLGFAFALAKFPDAQSCLDNPSEPLSVGSSLRWGSIKRPKQAVICFFNVAHAFGNRDLVRDWLAQMPAPFQSIYGVEVTLGREPTLYLALNLNPMTKRHCLANIYRCVFIHHQRTYIDMSAEGEVRLLHLNRPKISIN